MLWLHRSTQASGVFGAEEEQAPPHLLNREEAVKNVCYSIHNQHNRHSTNMSWVICRFAVKGQLTS